jgi:hypothetical protein
MSKKWNPNPPPKTFVGHLTVCDKDRNLIPGLRASLCIETDLSVDYPGVQGAERVEFRNLPLSRQGHGCYIDLEAKGFHDLRIRVACLPDMGEVTMWPAVVAPPVQQIFVDGKWFKLADGSRHFIKDATSFQSFKFFADGNFDALDAHFSQLREAGYNCHRVFLSCRNLFSLELSVDEMVDLLPRYVIYAAGHGLRANLVAFADTVLIGWSQEELEKRWLAYGASLQSVVEYGPLISLVNEVTEAPNVIPDVTRFGKIPNILCSRGSRGSRGAPVRPWMDWEEYHNNNEVQHWREAHNAMEFCEGAEGITPSGAPMHMSETKRIDNDPVVSHHRDSAQCAKLLIAGFCFHCKSLRYSEVLTGQELEAMLACVEGMDSISTDCQPGNYKHRSDLERPDAGATGERAYQRGDNDVCIAHSLKEG